MAKPAFRDPAFRDVRVYDDTKVEIKDMMDNAIIDACLRLKREIAEYKGRKKKSPAREAKLIAEAEEYLAEAEKRGLLKGPAV